MSVDAGLDKLGFAYLVHGVRTGYENHVPVRPRSQRPEAALRTR